MEVGPLGPFPPFPGVQGSQAERTAPSLGSGDGPRAPFQSGDYLVLQDLRGIRKASGQLHRAWGTWRDMPSLREDDNNQTESMRGW